MRGKRREKRKKDLNKPVSFWVDKELFWEKNRVESCLTIILRTTGCYWAKKLGCVMCGYNRESDSKIKQENVLNQLNWTRNYAEEIEDKPKIVKIFTSGSFFDSSELTKETRDKIYSFVEKIGAEKLIVESRPEFVGEAEEVLDRDFKLEVGIGLESSDDFIRNKIIQKGFTFENFRKASKFLKNLEIGVKAYLLLKPPFLSEGEAIEDAIRSSNLLLNEKLADVISLNLMNVQTGTFVERLWQRRLYRPPWLWSAAEVLRKVKKMGGLIISDPVAAGKKRGPHNCGKCDSDFAKAIKEFSLTQDERKLDLECSCKGWWIDYLNAEKIARVPVSLEI